MKQYIIMPPNREVIKVKAYNAYGARAVARKRLNVKNLPNGTICQEVT